MSDIEISEEVKLPSAKIIPFKASLNPDENQLCSFCGTSKKKAKRMVSTSDGRHSICDKCVDHCAKLKEIY